MLQAWVAWLEECAARAIDADPLLLDRGFLFDGIYRKRNGDAKLEKRIAYRAARGLPLWSRLGRFVAICCKRAAPMRLTPFSYFCTC
jgi:hypothetical protein